MKYIRTKDGRILKGSNYGFGVGMPYKNYDVKVADTIEELCDEFIIIDLNDKPVMKNEHERVKELLKVDIWHKKYKTIYGAIWTDKGLIYVAKMNKKGELELL